MNTLNNKNNVSSARTSDKKAITKSISSRANEKNSIEINKSKQNLNTL
ncbi:hypothetical protein ACHRV6_04735 [Flavobacterium sp. FlaQc-51]|jgi:hypothetical protein|nr:hypothetical protein [Flavobacterium sp. Leaf82]